MEGLKGLKLVKIEPNILSNTQIIFIKILILIFIALTIYSFIIAIKNKKTSNDNLLPSIVLTILSVIFILTLMFGVNKVKENELNDNIDYIYTLEIVDDNYHINTDIYDILNIEGNTIKVIK